MIIFAGFIGFEILGLWVYELLGIWVIIRLFGLKFMTFHCCDSVLGKWEAVETNGIALNLCFCVCDFIFIFLLQCHCFYFLFIFRVMTRPSVFL